MARVVGGGTDTDGTSSYFTSPGGPVEKVYDNCFVMRFDADGRCVEFTEWYVRRPTASIDSP